MGTITVLHSSLHCVMPHVSGSVGRAGSGPGCSGWVAWPRGARQRGQEQQWCRALGVRCQHKADACHSCPTDSAERVVQRFEAPGVSNYTALLLSPDHGTLYLGARELLLTLNTSNFQPSSPVRRVSPGMGSVALGGGGGTQLAGVQGIPSPAAFWVCVNHHALRSNCPRAGCWRRGGCGCYEQAQGGCVWTSQGWGRLPVTVPSPQLLWSADEEKKRQCVFKGKDPQVSPIASSHRGLWCMWAVPCAGWV